MDFGATYSGNCCNKPEQGALKDTALQYDEGHKKAMRWEFSSIEEEHDEVSDGTERQHSPTKVMGECACKAGILTFEFTTIRITTELEAAEPYNSFLVADFGGGTVDLAFWKIN
ncbi:hypothetical protein C1646_775941 [Rhizophagus diaphanus]|nr:hypothetical protein C1646_775941 [Rhizophagus diaphanus] [Rhizophagus sp. MUCL 43196]